MPRPQLTDEQRDAVCAGNARIFIEAAPGAGKTTVAAERYGVLRFNRGQVAGNGITAVSFTRSATTELLHRVTTRWGSSAVSWPPGVLTIDGLVCKIVEHLLRSDIVHWPNGFTKLEVLDDWRGHRGYRPMNEGSYRRVAMITTTGSVTSRGRLTTTPGWGIGSKADFDYHLGRGLCTHQDVRDVLTSVLRQETFRTVVADFIASSVAHVVVDEVFDANPLDLALVDLACLADVAVTLIGDPWQALYGFRGARPDVVPQVIEDRQFDTAQLTHSFRFQTDEMIDLAGALRSGEPVTLAPGDVYDVLLASHWDTLWDGPTTVLPLSFGRTTNKTDAAAIVLLDHLVYTNFNRHAIFLPEALILLGLDPDTHRTQGQEVLAGVIETLSRPGSDAPVAALRDLREAMKTLGASRRPPAGRGDGEERQVARLTALAARVRSGERLVPGMTIHQAKGREWDCVGVRLADAQVHRLAEGLQQGVEADRAIYVALTRARSQVRRAA